MALLHSTGKLPLASSESHAYSPMTPAQSVHALLGDESRKQRRRECHNQVEKRRREHINAMIEELNKLLPPRFKNPLDPDLAIEDDEEDDVVESPVKKKVCLGC